MKLEDLRPKNSLAVLRLILLIALIAKNGTKTIEVLITNTKPI